MNGWVLLLVILLFIVSVVLSVIFKATFDSSKQDGDRRLFIGAVVASVVFGLLILREIWMRWQAHRV